MDVRDQPDPFPFVRDRILELKKQHRLSHTQLAALMGYERTALHRWMQHGGWISTGRLYKLSQHFRLPMSHWFPEVEGNPLSSNELVLVQNLTENTTKLTKQIVDAVVSLPVLQKHQLLKFVNGSPQLLSDALEIMRTLSEVDDSTRKRIITTVAILVTMKRAPAP